MILNIASKKQQQRKFNMFTGFSSVLGKWELSWFETIDLLYEGLQNLEDRKLKYVVVIENKDIRVAHQALC
jgi:hypothetical protein